MHQEVGRRVAGSACRIGPQVVDPDSTDVGDLADHPRPVLGTLAPVIPGPDPDHAGTIARDAVAKRLGERMTATAQDTVEDMSSSRILGEQPVEQLIACKDPARGAAC
jgi:hypothetical protein